MKKILSIAVLAIAAVLCSAQPKQPVKVLAIGNSFSEDALEQNIHLIARTDGVPMVIGNMYIGGCSIDRHMKNVRENLPEYRYTKFDVRGEKTIREKVTLQSVIKDEQWDFVSVQQVSGQSGIPDSYSNLKVLVEWVRANAPQAKVLFHQTWAYAADSKHADFPKYNSSQKQMYDAICLTVAQETKKAGIDGIIPTGQAIQAAREELGDYDLTRDGYHMSLGIGRYIAACTWYQAITGRSTVGLKYRPDGSDPRTQAITAAQAKVAQKAADKANKEMNRKSNEPLRLAVAGVTHGHLSEVARRVGRGDFEVVGVSEPVEKYRLDNDLTRRIPADRFYASLEEMLDNTKPEVVVAYGSTFEHLEVVRACAPRGIHVMVEKPLSTTVQQAEEIRSLAEKYGIKVLVNYETTWYPSNTYVKKMVDEGKYGKIFKIEVYDGHMGPVELGCSTRFLDWLTDPILNGAGALYDFGCYGANLATWLFNGKEPLKVTSVKHTNKPSVYPKVNDDATILLEYDDAVVEINASWCWPYQRKDMRVYGLDGSVWQKDNKNLMEQKEGEKTEFEVSGLPAPYNDSFLWLKAVVRGDITISPSDQQALENNITVVKILEAAAKQSR